MTHLALLPSSQTDTHSSMPLASEHARLAWVQPPHVPPGLRSDPRTNAANRQDTNLGLTLATSPFLLPAHVASKLLCNEDKTLGFRGFCFHLPSAGLKDTHHHGLSQVLVSSFPVAVVRATQGVRSYSSASLAGKSSQGSWSLKQPVTLHLRR